MPLLLFGKGVQNDAHCNCIVPPWRHACDRNGKNNNNFHFWKQNINLVVRSMEIKEEAKNVMFWLKKDIWKVKNILLQWILRNILENEIF